MHEHTLMKLDGRPVRWRIERAPGETRVHVCVWANLCLDCGALVVETECLKDHRKIAK